MTDIVKLADKIHAQVSRHAFQRHIIDNMTIYELAKWFDDLERMLDNVACLADEIIEEVTEPEGKEKSA